MKRSFAARLAVTFILLIILVLVAMGLSQFFFLNKFYLMDKQRLLMQSYEWLRPAEANYSDEDFENFCSVNGFLYCVADPQSLRVVATNARDDQYMTGRLLGNLLGQEDQNSKVLREQQRFKIIRMHDRFTEMDYIELWGSLDNGNYYIVLSALDSISDAARISLQFYIMIGLAAVLAGAVLILLMSRRMVRPIRELTRYSQQMAELDFGIHYEGREEDEIGELGRNFNRMSEHLEKAVSDLKSANTQLQKDIEKKIEIDEMRREFLSNVSHELKTPIAIIQGYGEGLQEMIDEDPSISRHYADIIVDEAQKMNLMVKQLLSLNQLEFGNKMLSMERFDLAEVIRRILKTQAVMIEKKGGEVVFQPEGERKVPVWGDEFQIEEVLTNYLTNALNHLAHGHLIEITCEEKEGIVTTTVFNSGDPIPEEELPKIWIKFYKVDKARSRAYGGSGIGLSIVKAIMEAHHQRAGVKNYKDGVAFSFTLESGKELTSAEKQSV